MPDQIVSGVVPRTRKARNRAAQAVTCYVRSRSRRTPENGPSSPSYRSSDVAGLTEQPRHGREHLPDAVM